MSFDITRTNDLQYSTFPFSIPTYFKIEKAKNEIEAEPFTQYSIEAQDLIVADFSKNLNSSLTNYTDLSNNIHQYRQSYQEITNQYGGIGIRQYDSNGNMTFKNQETITEGRQRDEDLLIQDQTNIFVLGTIATVSVIVFISVLTNNRPSS
jgi:hypothetical protein